MAVLDKNLFEIIGNVITAVDSGLE